MGPLARARLIAEIVSIYARARRGLRSTTLEATVGDLRDAPLQPLAPGIDRVRFGRRLGRIVVRVLEPLPTDSRCLMRSLVLAGLLARRGVDGRLVLAVRAEEDFAAHAWVELDGRPLLEPATAPFERLVEL